MIEQKQPEALRLIAEWRATWLRGLRVGNAELCGGTSATNAVLNGKT